MSKEEEALIVEEETILPQFSEPAHNAFIMKQFLADHCIPLLKSPPNSLDLGVYTPLAFTCSPM
jgi:hypothetical protein